MIIAGTVCAYLTLSIDEFSSNLQSAMAMLGQLESVGNSITPSMEKVDSSVGKVASAMGLLGVAAAAAASSLSSSSQSAQGSMLMVGTTAAAAMGMAIQTISSAGASMSTAVGAAAASTVAAFQFAATGGQTSASDIATAMKNAAGNSAQSMGAVAASVTVLGGMQAVAASMAQSICDSIIRPMKGLGAATTAAGAAAGAGLVSGLESKKAAALAVANNIANAISSAIKKALQIASPSKVMRRLGGYTAEGLALGIEDMIPRVTDSAAAVARTVERTAAAVVPAPQIASTGWTDSAYAGEAPGFARKNDEQSELSVLSEKMDRLLDYLYRTEPVLRLDGRTFGRMVREYA